MAGAHKKRAAAIAAARKTKTGGRKKTVPGSGRFVAGRGCDGDGRRLLVLALGLAAVGGRGGLDQLEDAVAHRGIADLAEIAHQLERLTARDRTLVLLDLGYDRMLGPRLRLLLDAGHVLEEVGRRHVQDLGELLQAAGADAVQALLVLLDLLEAQADRRPKPLLAEARQRPAGPQPRPDMGEIGR